jgi:hypothetical protein
VRLPSTPPDLPGQSILWPFFIPGFSRVNAGF